jgi:truncated hemoglobin YjbI
MDYQPLSQQLTYQQAAQVTHRFYEAVLADPQLIPHFTHITDWPEHERYITDFWWGMLGGQVDNPRPNAMEAGHRDLDLSQADLQRWLELFEQTLYQELDSTIAARWAAQAKHIGTMMVMKGLVKE